MSADHPDPCIARVQALMESILDCIERGHLGSIGSVDNSYLPQIGAEDVRRWRADLAALLTERAASPDLSAPSYRRLTTLFARADERINAAMADPDSQYPREVVARAFKEGISACLTAITLDERSTEALPASPADPPPLPRGTV